MGIEVQAGLGFAQGLQHGAVEARQAVLVDGEVGWHPVQDDPQPRQVGAVDPSKPGVAAFIKAGYLVPYEAIGTAPAGSDVGALQEHLRAASAEIDRRGGILERQSRELSDVHDRLAASDADREKLTRELTLAIQKITELTTQLDAATAPARPKKTAPAAGE